ncbi:MAG: serine/threonine-protein kinase [Hyalangium sp.]|uniref:serine/threonine-protein kinase n=1 Tax=Hyalangium sp. TaxID=2028555 RepID=UPI00389A5F2C
METAPPKDPADLPSGTQVGAWQVVSRRGQGSYGVVYRVQRVGHPEAGDFALKLARHPMNPRFERERELLSRLHHAHVPRLHDSGWWKFADGISFPYVVMEWVEGEPLYEWADRRSPTQREVLRLVAQLARALEALHEVSGVHRDVKGDNVLVTEEGRAVLTDFGSGHYRGAFALTWQPVPPGTPRYWSPELVSHQWGFLRQDSEHYHASPADDVYALGVTTYRLVTGTYPPPVTGPERSEDGKHWAFVVWLPPEALAGVCPELATIIRRMLASEPSARVSAGELAQALENAVETSDSRADQLIFRRSEDASSVRLARSAPMRRHRALALGLVVTGSSLALLVLKTRGTGNGEPVERRAAVARQVRDSDQADGGTASLADAMRAERASNSPPVAEQHGLRLSIPKEPLPGQRKAPCGKYEVEINGGCWVRPPNATPPCGSGLYEWKTGCFAPTFEPQRPPTSEQP